MDLISRQAAIEVIDSFNVFESRSDQIKLEQMIGELPPAQPEIVRCKDCEHGVLDDGFPHQYFCVFKGDEWNNADYFCGHAKRKEVTT